ncbi:High-affinity branched-chain amino acid transport ATP-binding protein LivF [Sporomusa silvacetica DSM 10669]|uniref:High-affinity branched-chain amino acid transport ATP-binding protein LivF n=1 Tax=Sporomusa silvacetica DSM 10669 TaxID=1123289 RepID=A0ABZ3IQG7_9FIRM|nr:ABC transporter ATP-binding protein [Sporomusa silvacetica]OZC13827.1 high-affinity branched-chain amino acid transport ATP-binding protein LivF [Sporomusa silvacetica DSM 10669]
MLTINMVSTAYGSIPVLKDVSLKVPRGSITCLLGSNGAGKTTMIKTILGLVPALTGEIVFGGKKINGLSTEDIVKSGIAVVPEGRRVFPKMTVWENLQIGACNIKDKAQVRSSLDKVFTLFPRLAERSSQNAGTMSGGEQQMVAMGRAMMSQPQIMLMDEPSLGLAPLMVNEIFRTIDEISKEGTTVLLIEQNGFKAIQMSHHAYLLQKGRIILESTESDPASKEKIKEVYLKHGKGGNSSESNE